MHEVKAELKAKAVRALAALAARSIAPPPAPRPRADRDAPRAPSSLSRSLPSLAQKMAEDLEEAGNELIITDEDSVRFSVGETFVLVENDDAETMLEAHLAEVSKEVADLESEEKELAAAMAELKEKLGKKFGNAINLEE